MIGSLVLWAISVAAARWELCLGETEARLGEVAANGTIRRGRDIEVAFSWRNTLEPTAISVRRRHLDSSLPEAASLRQLSKLKATYTHRYLVQDVSRLSYQLSEPSRPPSQ